MNAGIVNMNSCRLQLIWCMICIISGILIDQNIRRSRTCARACISMTRLRRFMSSLTQWRHKQFYINSLSTIMNNVNDALPS